MSKHTAMVSILPPSVSKQSVTQGPQQGSGSPVTGAQAPHTPAALSPDATHRCEGGRGVEWLERVSSDHRDPAGRLQSTPGRAAAPLRCLWGFGRDSNMCRFGDVNTTHLWIFKASQNWAGGWGGMKKLGEHATPKR